MRTSTAKAILKKAGLMDPDRVSVYRDGGLEVEVMPDKEGENDLASKVSEALRAAGAEKFGGFRTGYNSWIFREGYHSRGDFMDKGSDMHYY